MDLKSGLQDHSSYPNASHCMMHIKLYEAFAQLIKDGEALVAAKARNSGMPFTKNAEIKQHYLALATERFKLWWNTFTDCSNVVLTVDNLPPLDVLLVWHSYLLTPLIYWEDCMRTGKRGLWEAEFPWIALLETIDDETHQFKPSLDAQEHFQKNTGSYFSFEKTLSSKLGEAITLVCPFCSADNTTPWRLLSGEGFLDAKFLKRCQGCGHILDHRSLPAAKLRSDLIETSSGRPLPGTLSQALNSRKKGLVSSIMEFVWTTLWGVKEATPSRLTCDFEKVQMLLDEATERGWGGQDNERWINEQKDLLSPAELSVLDRYWNNRTPDFGLDLYDAIERHQIFLQFESDLEWAKLDTAMYTLSRAVHRYAKFFQLQRLYPETPVSPPWDIDLAWHTHQIYPAAYFQYSLKQCGTVVDHRVSGLSTSLESVGRARVHTEELWRRVFGESLIVCLCSSCAEEAVGDVSR
ncbi:uncharacterized protein PAC_11478 [Phialocephala subalpina]|uniref:Uncharacterized protein n=1 Tax=Phialocephala subalpina TaxID=576137 RepID=A0A1L7X983_9HELO|nr:uncharacterized protein PAC_11478 [Phialocephala subalpina]